MSDEVEYQDIGHDVRIAFASWRPDRELNPQYADTPDVDRYMVLLDHQCGDGRKPNGCVLDGPVAREIDAGRPRWTVESWDPLTLSPSLLCRSCGLHGWIRAGRWVPA